jgi:hypothetical protein
VDNTGRDGRRLTVLCYLNPDYTGEHGGALKVYEPDDEDGTRGVEVAPSAGTIAMFYADQTPHEVLPSLRSRHSFTVWYYDDFEWKDAETRRGEAAAADSRAAHMPRVDGDAGFITRRHARGAGCERPGGAGVRPADDDAAADAGAGGGRGAGD